MVGRITQVIAYEHERFFVNSHNEKYFFRKTFTKFSKKIRRKRRKKD